MNTKSYADILRELNLQPETRYPWAYVGSTDRVQGWKLHLSSLLTEAESLLRLVVPFLQECGVSFKIAQDMEVLCLLNEGSFGATQIGKFMTIYPASDAESRQLAERLVEMTRGFHGPVIPSDMHLGSIVYSRYGGFNSILAQDRLGRSLLSIYDADGALRVDSYEIPFKTPPGVDHPFEGMAATAEIQPVTVNELLGSRYLLVDVLNDKPTGSVFLGLDLKTQEDVSIKVIKQGRKYCLDDEYGRDIRSRLKHQEILHQKLSGQVPIPKADRYFEENGDGYLPLEYLEGENLEMLVVSYLDGEPWNSLPAEQQIRLLACLQKTIDALKKLHHLGFIHRDLTGKNIWIAADENVYLIDFELTHLAGDPSPPFPLGTFGFMSPDQQNRKLPSFSDDIYSLGCVMVLLFTGLDPQRALFMNPQHRHGQLPELMKGVPQEIIELIIECVDETPSKRPPLDEIEFSINRYISSLISSRSDASESVSCSSHKPIEPDILLPAIEKGLKGLLDGNITRQEAELWLSASIDEEEHNNESLSTSYEIYRDANRGVAGVVYMLGRLSRFGYQAQEVPERVKQVIAWLLDEEWNMDDHLPGLHFGEAGVAVAIAEAVTGGLMERDEKITQFFHRALNGRLDWPDVTHGAAGQGIAALYCADRLKDAELLPYAERCVDYLIDNQKEDGSWEMPSGVDGMSGDTLTGFAHGVAGIVYFLAEYAHRYGHRQAQLAWQKGADWLIQQAMASEDGKSLFWDYSVTHEDRWKWWCHGSPGIALTFLRLYEHTADPRYAEIASKALQVHPIELCYPNLSQCHGLSGLGEIYLEAARVLEDDQWLERAEKIAQTLLNLRHETEYGTSAWLVENSHGATADLMVGSSGILHFLLRLSMRGEKMGFPLLLDPLGQ